MKPVQFRKSPKFSFSKAVVSLLLVVVLVACGTNAVTVSSPAQSHPISTANKPIKTSTAIPSTSTTVFNPNAKNVAENAGSLRLQSVDGFQCPNDSAAGLGIQDQLVFATDPTTYNQDQIAQIRSYMESRSPGGGPPTTLRWVLGGSVDRILGAEEENGQYYVPCGAKLALTNMGNTSIQILQVGMQLEELPEQNSYQYRLIDTCSVVPQMQSCRPPHLPGNSNTCSIYLASIQLGLGEKGAVYSAVPQPLRKGNNCGTLTIAPATQVDLILIFSLTANTPKNLIYSMVPVFTVDTAQGQQTLTLTQLGSTIVFASASQFSCYALQGSAFVLLQSPSAPANWCM